MGTDQQTDVCTCGHSRAAHFQLKSLACMKGDCICEAFDKVDPLIAAAPELLKSLEALVEQFHAYENGWLGEAWRTRIGLPRDLQEAEAAIRKAKGE